MMYILTQEEYDALKAEKERRRHLSDKKLGELCILIANTMPVKWGWDKKNDVPKPWGCRHTREAEEDVEWYCDTCPVQDICPLDHSYSK